MPLARLLSRSHLTIALGYIAGYVLLDWVSYVHPFAVSGITPWNPQTGLSFALILLLGPEFLPWLFVAPFVADVLVRQLPLPLAAESLVVLLIGFGYGGATALLLSPRVGFDPTLTSMRALLWLMAAALVSIAIVAVGHASVLVTFSILAPNEFGQAALRAFIGDVIGVTVVTPFLLIFFTRRRFPTVSWEALLLLLVIVVAVWAVFGFVDAYRFQLFYVLFIPIIWTAVRFGLEGVTAGLIVTQIGLIAAIQISGQSAIDVTAYQALMVVLAVTGLAIGVLVNAQQRTQQQLRLQQEALHRASRLGTMGEFAAAVAHEINQPLTAIANYVRLAKRAVEKRPPDAAAAVEAAGSAIEQVDRAAEVVRRFREFIRLGRSETGPLAVDQLVHEAQSFCRPELERHGVELDTKLARNLPEVMVDALQIEQVIVNLVRNAVEALSQAGRLDGRVTIEAESETPGKVVVCVRDNGPGFDVDLAEQPITPFATTKHDGLGLGLSLARSIVEAHGGKLRIESSPRGAIVSFTLQSAPSEEATA
jgi:signal transduction histidine kinase